MLDGVAKMFPNGTRALQGVSLSVSRGSVHGLVGANGAGKSTLIKIIAGAIMPSAGQIVVRGERVQWRDPAAARAAGIATVYQNTPLVPTVSVLENVFLGRRGDWRWKASARSQELERLFRRVGYEIAPDAIVSDLTIGDQQMVALLQALSQEASLLVLDEPTASLSHSERDVVYQSVRRLAAKEGIGILYVSHLLDEVMALTDVVTVLRDGRVTMEESTARLDGDRLVAAIVGRGVDDEVDRFQTEESGLGQGTREVLLDVRGLRSPGKVRGVSFEVAAGEVVGLAGLLGSGRSEILRAVFGADPDARGEVRVKGQLVGRSPTAAVRAGLGMVPEDRGRQGLLPEWEIWKNISLPTLSSLSWLGVVLRVPEELRRADEAIMKLSIRAPSADTLVEDLSGGNAQKTMFAKWLSEDMAVLLLDEPTVGIDIGSKREIHALIRGLAANGRGIVLVSSEFDELVALADRALVVRRGEIVGERATRATSEEELLQLASGLSDNDLKSGLELHDGTRKN